MRSRSGIIVTYGDFRMLDLGDLTWNKEYDLVCPANKLGPVDVYVVTHHGADIPDRRHSCMRSRRASPS